MNPRALHAALATLLLASGAAAQQPTLSAAVTEDLEAYAEGYCLWCFDWALQPVGPLPAGGVTLSASSFGSTAQTGAAELAGLPTGVTGFRWWATGSSSGGFEGAYMYTGGSIELQLTLPAPGPVLVVAEGSASTSTLPGPFAFTHTSTGVDVDGDQVIDWALTPGSTGTELGLRAGPGGAPIHLTHSSGAVDGSAASDLGLTFYPGNSPLASYGPGCVPLTWSRGPTGAATLSCPAPNRSTVVFVRGRSELQVQLPFAPGCFLLTNIVAVQTVQPSGGVATLALPDIALAPGAELRMQAIVFDGRRIRTSNGLVMTGS